MPKKSVTLYKVIIFSIFSSNAIAQSPGDTLIQLKGAIQLAEQNYHLLKSKTRSKRCGKKCRCYKTQPCSTIDASCRQNFNGQQSNRSILSLRHFADDGSSFYKHNYSSATGSAASILLNWQAITFGQRNAQIDLAIAEAKPKLLR
jgi:hypothetical protein